MAGTILGPLEPMQWRHGFRYFVGIRALLTPLFVIKNSLSEMGFQVIAIEDCLRGAPFPFPIPEPLECRVGLDTLALIDRTGADLFVQPNGFEFVTDLGPSPSAPSQQKPGAKVRGAGSKTAAGILVGGLSLLSAGAAWLSRRR